VGRLENIIARNRRSNHHLRERVMVSFVFGAIVLLIIALAVFTKLGLPPNARNAGEPPAAREGAGRTKPSDRSDRTDPGKRVDGVLLRATPAAKPAR
jgi:hypothetical protein